MKNFIKAATEFFENALINQLNRADIAAEVEALEYNTHLVAVTGSQLQASEVIASAIELAKCGIRVDEIPDLIAFYYRAKSLGLGSSDLNKIIQIKRIMG
jgi:hypothetical protein